LAGLASLVVALAAGLFLVAGPAPSRPAPLTGELTLALAFPGIKPVDMSGWLDDGTDYNPQFFLDPKTSLGTAPSTDKKQLRLLLRAADGKLRELRRLPVTSQPQYGAFTVSGDDVAWDESTAGTDSQAVTQMWVMNWRTGQPPRALTTNVGDAVFFNSQYDMVIADGRLYWVAAARTKDPVTEVRSVPLTGGAVTVRQVPGAYAFSAWPWLVSAGTGQTGPVQLQNLDTGKRVTVTAQPTELVTCSPDWCRVLILSENSAPARMELMRPDGSKRQRIAGASVSSAVIDVAVLDRFEILARAGNNGAPTSNQQLLLYDLKHTRTVVVANGVGMVLSRGGMLWWSTGDNETLAWHALDLHALR
jgi:hypothetical protein